MLSRKVKLMVYLIQIDKNMDGVQKVCTDGGLGDKINGKANGVLKI